MSLAVIQSLAALDRTGQVQGVLARLGLPAVVVPRPTDLDREDPDVDVLIVGARELSEAGLRRVTRWRHSHPATVAIAHLNGHPVDRTVLRAAGIEHVVRGPLTSAKLRNALFRADDALWDLLDSAGRLHVDEAYADEAPEPEDEVDVESDEDIAEADTDVVAPVDGRLAKLVTIASATGGCGKTFFATTAASVLAKAGCRALLIDLDLQFGEVAAALQVHHPYSLYDGLYTTAGQRLPAVTFGEHLEQLVCHHPLGFDVLAAPRDPVLADYVGARDATVVLDTVLPHYDVVIVDTPPSLNDVVIAALDRSDVVEVLATLDVPSLRNLTAFTDVLRRLGLRDDRLHLVLNKTDVDVGVTVAQANEAFDDRFHTVLPSDRAVSRAVNLGTTVTVLEPRSKVSRAIVPAIVELARNLDVELGHDPLAQSEAPDASPIPGRRWRRFLPGGNA